MKRKVSFIIVTVLLLITMLTISANAVSGFATSIGTTYGDIDTNWSAQYAAECYRIYGYSPSNYLMDPNYMLRLSNMGAKVQCYNEHGNVNLVRGRNSGIMVGQGDDTYVGTDTFNTWNSAGTILVSYICCSTAGDGDLDENSITYRTAVRGANVVLGFTNEIPTDDADVWSNRFNYRLISGYGVHAAAEYANSYEYNDDRVKNWYIVHHGEPNLNLSGNLGIITNATSQEIMSIDNKEVDRNILNRIKVKTDRNVDNYIDIISMLDTDFNLDNYEISKSKSGHANVLTGEREEKEYINLKLKIGDFITNAGYVVELENDNILAIYDNNVDLDKQKMALKNNNMYELNNISRQSDLNEEFYIRDAIEQVTDKFKGLDVNISTASTKYYYDIENDQKYFTVNVKVELNKDNMISISEETINFEID